MNDVALDVGRFNSVEPTYEHDVEPMIGQTHKNVNRTIKDVALDIGKLNSVESLGPK